MTAQATAGAWPRRGRYSAARRGTDRSRSRHLEQLVHRRLFGVSGDFVGRQIDRIGGRQVLCAPIVVLAAGLALLGASAPVWTMSTAWLLLGIGMGLSLYDAAFGALGRIYGSDARSSITAGAGATRVRTAD